jgi:hypothetical protein
MVQYKGITNMYDLPALGAEQHGVSVSLLKQLNGA